MSTEKLSGQRGRALRLHEQVALELKRRILQSQFKREERLTEVGVARDFGVSRATVRNAFKNLEKIGLIEHGGKRGYIVSSSAIDKSKGAPYSEVKINDTPLINVASWEGIYQDLSRKAVARSAYGSWRIIETELASSYDVSRTVAREVLARLEHVGIIRKDNRGRWVLPALTPQRVTQLYEMRWILEPMALRHASPNVPRALLEEMQHELDIVLSQPEFVPPQEFDRLEQRLHIELLSYGDNAILIETLQHYHALLITNAHLYDTTPSAYEVDPFMGEHLEIVNALLANHIDVAADRLERHLKGALGRVLGRIDYMVKHKTFEPLAYLKPLEGG